MTSVGSLPSQMTAKYREWQRHDQNHQDTDKIRPRRRTLRGWVGKEAYKQQQDEQNRRSHCSQ